MGHSISLAMHFIYSFKPQHAHDMKKNLSDYLVFMIKKNPKNVKAFCARTCSIHWRILGNGSRAQKSVRAVLEHANVEAGPPRRRVWWATLPPWDSSL